MILLNVTFLNKAEEEELVESNVIKYSYNMHPISKLTITDFMDRDQASMIDAICTILYSMLPMTLNYFVNHASTLINIFFTGSPSLKSGLKQNTTTFSEICMGTVIANFLIFYLIEYVGAGFAIVCSYFTSKEKE